MVKYYTRACNFYFGSISRDKVKKKLSIALHGNDLISFDNIEIISRKNKKILHIQEIKNVENILKKKILFDLKQISKKKKIKN